MQFKKTLGFTQTVIYATANKSGLMDY